ncbi:hypothetical protein Pan97_07230 [Bremerella volcania]|uniref:Glycosyl transferase family 2 n=1 Tax=Bremerella volcania TaxID=2527984 RepID=A0A518C3F5_9BACT|nr:hypothetical protein [Bremerella volcania]QDU73724.1 hypothetical protein Pan97_07230 [Bremerella volcania]
MIGCILLTYNRFSGDRQFLLSESVESFLRQTHQDAVLLICNDTPGQKIQVEDEIGRRIRIFNFERRFPFLTDKIQAMIDKNPDCDMFCRWDDDDISLPNRLTLSHDHLLAGNCLEWRPNNYVWSTSPGSYRHISKPGNTHVMSLWRRDVLKYFPEGKYPQRISGWEDQTFNQYLSQYNVPRSVEKSISYQDVTYVYRWGASDRHLSSKRQGSDSSLQAHYDSIGTQPIRAGNFTIHPYWQRDYESEVRSLDHHVSDSSRSRGNSPIASSME